MKTLTIDAIVGAGFHSVVIAQECERLGLAEYDPSGNGNSMRWSWRREKLEGLDLDTLQELYTSMREARETLDAQMAEQPEPSLIVLN